MLNKRHFWQVCGLALFLVSLSACGGGSSAGTTTTGTGGSGGGGGGNNMPGPSISQIAPSAVMQGVPQGIVYVYGSNFGSDSQVEINGQPATSTQFVDPQTLEAQIDVTIDGNPGSYQFSVQDSAGTSNLVPYVVYAPTLGPEVMSAVPTYFAGGQPDPQAIAVGDVNGDGYADVLMTGPQLQNSGSIAILHGSTAGKLSIPTYLSGDSPWAPALGDVNGDGSPDILSLPSNNSSTTTLKVLLNDGRGNFSQVSTQSFSGTYPGPALVADLDGDGMPDLVLAVQNATTGTTGMIDWLRNLGDGNFAAPVQLAVTAGDNRGFSVADFNGDTLPDILYTAVDSSTGADALHILFNQGGGTFVDTPVSGLNGVTGVATPIDFNHDGIPDLAVQTSSLSASIVLYSFQGNGDGSFTQVASNTIAPAGFAPYSLVVGDFDHDGNLDLAGANGEVEPSHVLYLFGDGMGNFTPLTVVGPQGFHSAVGDINGDGIPDVVVPDRFGFAAVSLGRNGRHYAAPISLYPKTIAETSVGDVNGDGLPEIFVGGDRMYSIPGSGFLNQGNGSFAGPVLDSVDSLSLEDLTGKGVADLLGTTGSDLLIWPNNGTLNFGSSPITIAGSFSGPFDVADMDGDGHPDIVTDGQILYGNGSYQFTPVTLPNSPFSGPYVVGDFNGDGQLDIVAGAATYLNQGNRTFTTVREDVPLSGGALAVAGDFNGDGHEDVAVALPGSASVSVWYGRGDGTFYQAADVNTVHPVSALSAGDFNADGLTDLAVGLTPAQDVGLFFSQGNGQFKRSFIAAGAYADAVLPADLNNDGKLGLVVPNFKLNYRPPNVEVIFHQ
jgi:hypothetical protein